MNGFRRYTELQVLGGGSCGRVVLAVDDKGQKCAVKEIDCRSMYDEDIEAVKQEALTMAGLNHPNIVKYLDHYQAPQGRFCIVMELAEGGTLYDRIHNDDDEPIPEETILEWLCQICLGLRYLHGKGLIHRDLKSQNVMLSRKGRIKIGDFGIAKRLAVGQQSTRSYVGTPLYLAPEIILKMRYTSRCDMWSLGVLLYELCNKAPPFRGCSLDAVSQAILEGNYMPINPCYSDELVRILQGLLCSNPALRLSASEVLILPICRKSMKSLVQRCSGSERPTNPAENAQKNTIGTPRWMYKCRLAETIHEPDQGVEGEQQEANHKK